jgi:hypothetical protein
MVAMVGAEIAADTGRINPHAVEIGMPVMLRTVYYEYVPDGTEPLDTDIPLASRAHPVTDDQEPSLAREVGYVDVGHTLTVTHAAGDYLHLDPVEGVPKDQHTTTVVPRDAIHVGRLVAPSIFQTPVAEQYAEYQLWHPGSQPPRQDPQLEFGKEKAPRFRTVHSRPRNAHSAT